MTNKTETETEIHSIEEQMEHKVPPIIYHVRAANLSPYTRKFYGKYINRFLAHFQIKDYEPLKEYSLQICKQMMIDYVIHMREKEKLSRSSIKLHLAAIHYFFVMIREDEFPIKWQKINIHIPPNERQHRNRGYSVDEIHKILEQGCKGRLREKTVILLLASAGGMRIGAIPKLQKGHLKEMNTSTGEKVYSIHVYADSSDDYFTPCSPECTSMIDKYFEERVRDGEVLKHDSPLIRNRYNSLNVKHAKPFSVVGVNHILMTALVLSGVRDDFDFKGQVKMSRGFRKFYKSEADLSGMLPATVELTQGHNIGMPGHYLRFKDSEILQDYEKVIDRITIDRKHRLEKENQELKKNQTDYLAELGDLRHDFNEMKQLLVHLNKESQKELVSEFFQKVGDKADIEWSCDN